MKKASIIFIAFFLVITIKGYSQNITPRDFYVGKWEITIFGTRTGDTKLKVELKLKDGKLIGEFIESKNDSQIEEVTEEGGKIMIAFSSNGMTPSLELEKVDENNLKGSLMSGRFDAKAVRIKE